MNRTVLIRSAAGALTLLGMSAAMAAPDAATGYDLYDRVARSKAAEMRAAPAPARLVPGPYAQHLIYLGVDADRAIQQARAVGEQAMPGVMVPAQRQTGGFDLYDRIAAGRAAQSGNLATR